MIVRDHCGYGRKLGKIIVDDGGIIAGSSGY